MHASLLQMLGTPWRTRDRQRPWGRRVIAALIVLMLAMGVVALPGAAKLLLVGAGMSFVVAGWWMSAFSSLLVQNHPHAARLVPGHLRRLREAALLGWGGATAVVALMIWLPVTSLSPGRLSLPFLLLASGASLAFAAWSLRYWMLWLLLSFGPPLFFGSRLDRALAPLAGWLREQWLVQPWSLTALGLLGLAATLPGLFGDGGAAHRTSHARQLRMRQLSADSMSGKHGDLAARDRAGEWLSRPFEHLTAAWLRDVLRRAAPTERSAMQRLALVLHGQQHWVRQMASTAVALLLLAVGAIVVVLAVGDQVAHHWTRAAFGLALGLTALGCGPAFGLPGALWRSRREQALLRLLPGVPQGRAQNRAVAGLQLRHALASWALSTAMVAVLAAAAGEPGLLCLPLAVLPLGALTLLRAPARLRPPTLWSGLPMVAWIAGGGALYALNRDAGLPMPVIAAVCVGGAVLLGLWCWHLACRAPQPLPAARY